MRQLQEDALVHLNSWCADLLPRPKSLLSGPEPPRRPKSEPPTPTAESSSTEITEITADLSTLQKRYPPAETRLAALSTTDHRRVLHALPLFMLTTGTYAAYARVLLLRLASSLDLVAAVLAAAEKDTAHALLAGSKAAGDRPLSGETERVARGEAGAGARAWKIAIAAVADAALLGVTGGLAAPLVAGAIGGMMGGVGLDGVAGVLGFVAGNGTLMGARFGVLGGKMRRERMDAHVREVEDFAFVPLEAEEELLGGEEKDTAAAAEGGGGSAANKRLRVTIGISGWLDREADMLKPWTKILSDDTDGYVLRYDVATLLDLGRSLHTIVTSSAVRAVELELLHRTVLATLLSTLWPLWLLNSARIINNPWALAPSS